MTESTPTLATEQPAEMAAVPQAVEFILKEYEMLNQWAMHGDLAINQIFNFYLTLLTAAVGGTILIIDAISGGLIFSLVIVCGIAFLILSIGAVFFDSLVSQAIRNAYYYYGLLSIQVKYFGIPLVARTLRERPPFAIEDIFELEDENGAGSAWSRRLQMLTPVGIQMIFIAFVNSLLVMIIIVCLVRLNGPFRSPISSMAALAAAFFASFFTQSVFARAILNKHLQRCREISRQMKAMMLTDHKEK